MKRCEDCGGYKKPPSPNTTIYCRWKKDVGVFDANKCFRYQRKWRKTLQAKIVMFGVIAILIWLALLLAGCQGTSYEHKITYPGGYVDSTKVSHTKILVFTETKELSFVTPDGARLGVGWMTMDPQAAVDFAKAIAPPLWKLLRAYFAPLPVSAALGGE